MHIRLSIVIISGSLNLEFLRFVFFLFTRFPNFIQKPSIICVISKNNLRPEFLDDGDCIYKTNGSEAKAEVSSEEKGSGVVGLPGRVDEINQEEQVEIETRTEFWKTTAFVESVKEPEKGRWRNRGRTSAGVSRDKDQRRRSV